MTTSITRRLVLGLTVTVGLSWLLVVTLLVVYETRTTTNDLTTSANAAVGELADMMEPALWDLDMERAARVAEAFARDPRIARLTVREETTGESKRIERIPTADTALRARTVRRGDRVLGEVSVAFDRGYYRRQITRQVANTLLVALIALIATLVSFRILFRRLLRTPLDELSAVVNGYAEGRYVAAAQSIPYTEFQELGRVLDSMSAQIREQLLALGTANRDLNVLNRFLVIASAESGPEELLTEAMRELREVFGASRVRAELIDEQGAMKAVLPVGENGRASSSSVAALEVPIALGTDHYGRLTIAREPDRGFTAAELSLANAVAAHAAQQIARYRAHRDERLLRTAIEQLDDSVIMTDRQGLIFYVNPAFTRITGYTPQEAFRRRPRDLKGTAPVDPTREDVLTTMERGRVWIGRLSSRKKTGETFFEDWIVSPVRNDAGEVAYHVGIGRDVTIDMQRDEQLRHAQRMEGVGLLAGGVAHDFNNILGAVLMQLELLEIEHDLSPPVRQAMYDMRDAMERAANLTRQLLMFSRRQAMKVEPLDLGAVVADMLRMLRRVIGERIDISFAQHDEPVCVEGDTGMIEQVIVNLCVNARDAMPDGGRLALATSIRTFEPGAEHPGRWACLEVSDNGTGMSAHTLSHMFEPFFTTKEVGRGTGLGLATTHGIVTQHGGWITVDSTLGAGTTFRIYLPALVNVQPPARRRLRQPTRRGTAGVLVVEDEGLVRQMVSRSLRRLGHRVVEATTGREAMRIWADESDAIDVLLTDMVMPDGINGVQLVEELRRTHPTLRAIVMSGYSSDLSAESIPADIAFLSKPFSLASLSRAIEDSLVR